jgi:predicted methyltransferase
MRNVLIASLLLAAAPAAAQDSFAERAALASVGDHRSEANRARNEFRHPVQTLQFFGIEDGMSVLEISPGGGWYTEVLAPALRDHGRYVIAHWDPAVADQPAYRYRQVESMQAKFAERPELYDQVEILPFSPPASASLGDAGRFDVLLTFRNTHGWVNAGIAADLFREFARVLKPGGVLGVVQHRAAPGSDAAAAASGYVPEELVKRLAAEAGLEFVASSEVNGNPLDTRDHPEGVWTLPPSLRLGDQDRARYLSIGESDRMTLKFRKLSQG